MSGEKLKRMLRQGFDTNDRGLILTPRYERWLDLHGGEFVLSPIEAARFGRLLADHLSRKPRVRAQAFSASARGYCERQQVFGYLGVPQRLLGDNQLALMFIDGKIKHLTWQFIGLEAEALTDIETPVDADAFKKWRLRGSIDGTKLFDGIGMELKSTQAFVHYAANGPGQLHMLQVHSYFEAKPEIDVFCIVYWDTATRSYKEYPIIRQKQYTALVRNELQRLNEAVEHKQLPEVLNECKNSTGKAFRDCGYNHVCLGCKSYEQAEAWVSITTREAASVPSGGGDAKPDDARKGTRRVRRRVARKTGPT